MQKRIKKRLEAHFHQDFGMGVANTIMALSLGVEVMHTTVLGIGERSGNAPGLFVISLAVAAGDQLLFVIPVSRDTMPPRMSHGCF